MANIAVTLLILAAMACQDDRQIIWENQSIERELINKVHPKMIEVWPTLVAEDSILAARQEPCQACVSEDDSLAKQLLSLASIDNHEQFRRATDELKQTANQKEIGIFISDYVLNASLFDGYTLELVEVISSQKADSLYSKWRSSCFHLKMLKRGKTILLTELRKVPVNRDPLMIDYQVLTRVEMSGYDSFLDAYLQHFNRKISYRDLFDDKIAFGQHCGWAGIDPPYEVYCKKAVEMRDTALFTFWLSLPSLPKQLYAYKGLLALENKGLKLSMHQNALITDLLARKGEVYTCSGCIYSTENIESVIRQIEREYHTEPFFENR